MFPVIGVHIKKVKVSNTENLSKCIHNQFIWAEKTEISVFKTLILFPFLDLYNISDRRYLQFNSIQFNSVLFI